MNIVNVPHLKVNRVIEVHKIHSYARECGVITFPFLSEENRSRDGISDPA